MHAWMYGRMHGCVDACMDAWMDKWTQETTRHFLPLPFHHLYSQWPAEARNHLREKTQSSLHFWRASPEVPGESPLHRPSGQGIPALCGWQRDCLPFRIPTQGWKGVHRATAAQCPFGKTTHFADPLLTLSGLCGMECERDVKKRGRCQLGPHPHQISLSQLSRFAVPIFWRLTKIY